MISSLEMEDRLSYRETDLIYMMFKFTSSSVMNSSDSTMLFSFGRELIWGISIKQYISVENHINFISMNPEKYREHDSLGHSILWRKPMLFEKAVPEASYCHKQLNEHGQTGISWRTRNSFVQTNFSGIKNKSSLAPLSSRNSRFVDKILRPNEKQTSLTKSMMSSLKQESETLERSRQLVEGMAKLKDIDLLVGKELQKVAFPGVIRHAHVHNDYHTRETNPGFSRNYQGKIYTK